MKNLISVILVAVLLSGCNCNQTICDCFDQCEKSINFAFSTDSLNNGFKVAEIDTVIIYKLPKGQLTPVDSSILILKPDKQGYDDNWNCGYHNTFSIKEGSPFRDQYFNNFDYQIKLPNIKTFQVTNILLEGRIGGDKCCECYTNTKKVIEVNSITYDVTDNAPNPKIIELIK